MKPQARTVLAMVAVIGFILVTGGFFSILLFGDKITLPEGEIGKQIIGMLGLVVGTWNAAMLMVFTFNFGSSKGSQDKGDTQNKILERVVK